MISAAESALIRGLDVISLMSIVSLTPRSLIVLLVDHLTWRYFAFADSIYSVRGQLEFLKLHNLLISR